MMGLPENQHQLFDQLTSLLIKFQPDFNQKSLQQNNRHRFDIKYPAVITSAGLPLTDECSALINWRRDLICDAIYSSSSSPVAKFQS